VCSWDQCSRNCQGWLDADLKGTDRRERLDEKPASGGLAWRRPATGGLGIDGTSACVALEAESPQGAAFREMLDDPTTQGKFAKGFTNHEQTDASGLIVCFRQACVTAQADNG